VRTRFIDLFCGIGGMRLGFEAVGAESKCVFSSDWDKHAQTTYEANFGERPVGDIRSLDVSDIPDHEVLVAGFPCQPFSISGVSKKKSLGKPHGFKDKTQGTLFFEVAKIIDAKRPEAFVLENVKNLLGHDRGRTFKTIFETLDEELEYDVHFKIFDAKHFVPQHRERIFIVGFRKPRAFAWPELSDRPLPRIGNILDDKVPAKYTLTDHLWNYLQRYAEKHRAAGNGFGFGLVEDMDGQTRCLSARYFKDGSEILVSQGKRRNPRRLTPRECARLMGFPDTFKIPVSDTQAYKQFGNSVVVPLVEAIATQVVTALRSPALTAARPRQLRLLAAR
jgi:DNA (cytosine-5)-methyltransferase 1